MIVPSLRSGETGHWNGCSFKDDRHSIRLYMVELCNISEKTRKRSALTERYQKGDVAIVEPYSRRVVCDLL